MKKLTSIFALFIALLMIMNSVSAFALDTSSGLISITLQENFSKDITVNIKQYDGSSMADVDCSKVVLEGKLNQDDVYLAADGIFDSVDASDSKRTVKIRNFRLEGNDKNKYILNNSIDEINKRAFIIPKEISVEPEIKSIYFGQDIPSNIEMDIEHNEINTGDSVHLTANLTVDCENPEVGKYKFLIGEQTTDNSNYTLKICDDVLFEIKEYDPGVEAIPENKNNIYFSNTVKLTAPDGFYISSSTSDFKPEITLKIEKTLGTEPKEVSYYLRNIDNNSEEYNAISKELKYSYFCSTDQPVIAGAEISTEDSDEILKFINFGVVSGGSVTIKVSAKGTNIDQPTTIYLSYGDKTESRTVENGEKIDDIYYYSAIFTINVSEDECISSGLRAYASNASGSGSIEDLKITDSNGNSVYGNNKNYIILDKVKPSVSNLTVYYDNKNKYIKVGGIICDAHSGIDKIEYKFNNDSQYIEYGKNTNSKYFENGSSSAFLYSHNPNNTVDFKIIIKYDDISFTETGANILSIKITDNAGNVYENSDEYKQEGNGYDAEAPVVTYINIKTQNEKNALNNVLNFFSFGNFSKERLKIIIKAKDISQSNYISKIDRIALYDGEKLLFYINGRIDKKGNDDENYEYIFSLTNHTDIKNMYIVINDKADNVYRKSVLEEIRAHLKDIDSDSLPDECLSKIQCNSLLIEDNKPIITFDTDQSSLKGDINTDGNIWYNRDGGLLTISAYDPVVSNTCSGLKEVIIEDYDESDTVRTIDTPDFNNNQLAINKFSYQIDTLQLCNGFHNFVVTAVDNAGNINIDNEIIYVDKTVPNASVTVDTPDSALIDDKFWFDYREIITFRVNAFSEVSEIENIKLKINDVNFNFSKDHIQKDENGYYVEVDTKDISYDDRHTYNVSGVVKSVAQNSADIDPFTVYVDCENPVINNFTVEKKNTALDKILNILSFGIFSNDSLVFKAYVSDADFDSGIDYVTIWHNKLIEPIKMCKVDDGIFSAVLSAGTEVFQSNIVIKVYDKFGKVNISLPNDENTEPKGDVPNNVFTMIEKVKPIVKIDKPDGDGVKRTDGQIWYNSNKPITVKVQDADSGIRSVDIKVNGVNIDTDKNGVVIPQISTTEATGKRNTQEHMYVFDTEYFTSKVEKPSDGKYVISVMAVDNAGNIFTIENDTYYIDDVSPYVSKFEFNPVTSDNISETSEYIEVLEYGLFFKTEFIADVLVEDDKPTSGLDRLEYSLITYDDGKPTDKKTGVKEISNGIASFKIPEGFKGQISVKVYDKAGNSSDDITPQAFVVDEEAPQIDIGTVGDSGYYDTNGNKIFTSDVNMTVTIRDEKSGIREIGYSQSSEKNGFSRKTVTVSNTGNSVDNDIGDGWIITDMDSNLVTEITKTFTFNVDNNDVVMFFDASDCSGNVNDGVVSEQFTIDTIDPVINVECSSGINGTPYYNADNKAVITVTVTERNFSAELIDAVINNNYGNLVPPVNFESVDNETYRAVITLPEGDFTFSIRGTDLGGHTAEVILPENGIGVLYVDETAPIIEENFKDFSTPQNGNYFNQKKTAVIKVIEHNFRPDLIGLKILKKDAGLGHSSDGFDDVTYLTVSDSDWVSKGDVHTLKVNIDTDAIYSIEVSPTDPSGNHSEHKASEIFEIDTTLPVVISKNGNAIEGNKNATEFLDIYPYSRKDESEQNVKFMDVNLDYIRYSLTVYTPEYAKGRELAAVSPVKVYLDEDKDKSGKINGDLFTLPNFSKDGVYALELVAVDKAGNESILNKNTYMRIVESDVLAYIPNSNLEKNTGWYSFQYENGDPISKRPDNFSDIDIVVLAKKGSKVDVVLRDYNGEEINTNIIPTVDETIYGVNVYRYVLKSDYFRENFRNDTDAELYLSVKNDGKRIDLGKIHIDNIVPSCIIPQELKSWHWFFGNDTQEFNITGISELLDESKCNVYDNGKKIKFLYSAENNSLTFSLEKGWHNVGVELVDIAGNSYNVQEIKNIHIGMFWLIVIIVTICLFVGTVVLVLYKTKKRQIRAFAEEAA